MVFSANAEIHAGNDRLSEREDSSSQAPTQTTAVSEAQQAQARREARSEPCL